MKCCICRADVPLTPRHLTGDPYPIGRTGRCCKRCDREIVLPVREQIIMRRHENNAAESGFVMELDEAIAEA